MNAYLVIAIINESGDGYELSETGRWYSKGSRCWDCQSCKIHSIHTRKHKAEKMLAKLSPEVEFILADPADQKSPIDYLKITKFKILELCPGGDLDIPEQFFEEEEPKQTITVDSRIFSI